MSWCCAGGCTCGSEDDPNPLVIVMGFLWWGFVLSMTIWACWYWLTN